MRLRATLPLVDDSDETRAVDNRRLLPVVPGGNRLSSSSSKVGELGDDATVTMDGMMLSAVDVNRSCNGLGSWDGMFSVASGGMPISWSKSAAGSPMVDVFLFLCSLIFVCCLRRRCGFRFWGRVRLFMGFEWMGGAVRK